MTVLTSPTLPAGASIVKGASCDIVIDSSGNIIGWFPVAFQNIANGTEYQPILTATTNPLTGGIENLTVGGRSAGVDLLARRQSGGTVMVDWAGATLGSPTANWTVTKDSAIQFGGNTTLKVLATAGAADTMTCTITVPATFLGGAKRIGFAVKTGDPAIAGSDSKVVQLWFGYSASTTHRVQSYSYPALALGDWSEGVLFDQDASGSGHLTGTAQWAKVATENVTTITLVMTKTAGQAITEPVYISPVYTDANSPATLTIFMDGQYSGQWAYARQILQAYNLKASMAILPYWINDYPTTGAGAYPGTMTETQMLAMYSLGHEFIAHTGTVGPGGINVGWDNATKYPDGSEYAGVLADLTACREWMQTRNCIRGIDYAVGGFTNGLIATQTLTRRANISNAIHASGIKKVRQLGNYLASYYGCAGEDDTVVTQSHTATSADSTATLTGIVDKIIARGGWSGLTFHDLVLSGATGNSLNVADFETVMDYISTKVAAGTLRVRLFSEAMQEFDAIPAPV